MENNKKEATKSEALKSTRGELHRFLGFSLGLEEFAIPLLSVKEVIAMPEFTPIPYTPAHFLGIMNLRGQVISVIDLRKKFNIKAEMNAETAVIICDLGSITLGIVVNSVDYVLNLALEDIQPRPEIQNGKNSEYITGVSKKDKKLVLLLDIAKALDVADHLALQQSKAAKKAA